MGNKEQEYKALIAKEIHNILEMEQNKTTASLFWDKLKTIKPKNCTIKSGLASEEGIDFLVAFEKGGDENPFELFIENIPEASFRYGFIFGLSPNIFHFNPEYSVSNETHDFVKFKLLKNGK